MNKYIIITALVWGTTLLHAQWNCRSRLGAFLKPVGQSNLMWAGEIETSQGYLTNKYIANGIAFTGLDYSTKSSTFYFEGGIKYWRQKDQDSEIIFDNYRFGFREGFYKYHNANHSFTLGLHSSRLGDNYLLNERVFGLSYMYNNEKWKVNLTAGSVSNDFARNGTFCSTCYIYDIIQDRNINNISTTLGKTNLTALTISLSPGQSAQGDEFSEFDGGDEFSSMDDFQSKYRLKLHDVGFALYSEFGDEVNTSFITLGLYANIELGKDFNLKPEVLYQMASANQGIIYNIELQKDFILNNGHKTSFLFDYYDFSDVSKDATVLNRYSNILAGEVLRLDATEMPLFLASAKYIIPKAKAHFKFQYTISNQTSSMQEYDAQAGKIFFKHLQVNGIMGYIKSDLIQNGDHAVLGRLELRYNF